jgi:hypothetical protein
MWGAGLVLGGFCSSSIARERRRGTWESLLVTPLTAEEIVADKARARLHATLPLFFAYALPSIAVSLAAGIESSIVCCAYVAAAYGVMTFAGMAGVCCSARESNSWGSLLSTIAWLIGGAALVSVVAVAGTLFAGGFACAVAPGLGRGFLYGPSAIGWLMFGLFWPALSLWGYSLAYRYCRHKAIERIEMDRAPIRQAVTSGR